MATRMKREYSSAFSLTVWIRVCGGEGWASMLLCSHRVLLINCRSFVWMLIDCSIMMHKRHQMMMSPFGYYV